MYQEYTDKHKKQLKMAKIKKAVFAFFISMFLLSAMIWLVVASTCIQPNPLLWGMAFRAFASFCFVAAIFISIGNSIEAYEHTTL